MAFARTDRFGQKYTVCGLRDKKNNGFPSGIVTLKGQKYKLTISDSKKEGVEHWLQVTELKKRTNSGM